MTLCMSIGNSLLSDQVTNPHLWLLPWKSQLMETPNLCLLSPPPSPAPVITFWKCGLSSYAVVAKYQPLGKGLKIILRYRNAEALIFYPRNYSSKCNIAYQL